AEDRERGATDEAGNDRPPSRGASDPLAEEKRRRAYESLFADNIALTRRPSEQHARPLSNPRPGDNDQNSTLAALDQQAHQAFERLNESVTALRQTGDVSGPSTRKGSEAEPSATSESKPVAPAHTPPIEPGTDTHRLLEGTVIETTLMTRLEGDFIGPVLCLVTSPVYSHNGDAVVIPAGTKVLGTAKAVDTWGQRRLAVAFHRLILPDGETFSLDQFAGLDQGGDSGLKDQVNHHYWSTFGAAAAVGLISGLAQYVSGGAFTGGDGDRTVVIAGGTANTTAQAAAQVMNRYMNRLPTITIREGHRLKVYLTQDLTLPAYQDNRRVLATR
ncbi:MAG: TrbI/VirB10 family protein, partial [Vicinamibacteraceae bacterium]